MKNLPAGQDNPENNQQQTTPTTYGVSLTVTNATNQKLGNVTVTLTDTSDSTNTANGTTENGEVTISVKPGTYSVTAIRDGYIAPENIPNITVTNADVTVTDAIVMTSE